MKPTFFFSACTLLTLAISLQSCAIGGELVSSKTYSVTHEHRVNLPASMYSPGAGHLPMFDKKGEKSIAFSMTNSGENEGNDPNPSADPNLVRDGFTEENIAHVRTFSAGGGYALTDRMALIGNIQAGSGRGTYKPYIESWNLTEDVYDVHYWAGIPVAWDVWLGGDWYSTEKFTTLNDYQRVGKTLERNYRYFDTELGVGRYQSNHWLRSAIYGGLGYAHNRFEGHLDRQQVKGVYAEHDATFVKVFAYPAVSAHKGWLECGASLKTSFLLYSLKQTSIADRNYSKEKDKMVALEPALFLRLGPKYFQLQVEHKWLGSMGDMPFPTNKSFTSASVISTF